MLSSVKCVPDRYAETKQLPNNVSETGRSLVRLQQHSFIIESQNLTNLLRELVTYSDRRSTPRAISLYSAYFTS